MVYKVTFEYRDDLSYPKWNTQWCTVEALNEIGAKEAVCNLP